MTKPRPPRRPARRPAAAHSPPPLPVVSPWVGRIAGGAVALCAFVFGLHKLDDFDTWWHLAAGRWVATHGSIPSTDTLSHTVRDHAWTNLQWGFDLVLYALHQIGGPTLLVLAGAATFLATAILLLRLVNARLDGGTGALFMLLVVLAAQERVTLRPELASFLLLATVLTVLDHGRQANGRGLWRLVPLMVVWVNVHALFVIGGFAIACAMVGSLTRPGRPLLFWGGLAIASVVVNPYGIQGVLFPFELLSRISGSVPVFSTIGEFGSPFAEGATGVSIAAYKVLLGLGIVAAAAALVIGRRRADWGGLLFFAGLAVVSAQVRRNVALFAIGAAPFVAACLAAVLEWAPRLRAAGLRRAAAVGAVTVVAATALSATVVTGAFYRFENSPQEFGTGVIEGAFPMRAAAFARAAALPPKLFNDMSAGGYLSWDDPIGDGVFVDGRLEVYDAAFLTDYVTGETDVARWQRNADRYGVQTAIVFHRFENERVLVGGLARSPDWTLVYADEVAAIFVRAEGNDAAIARAAALRPDWDRQTSAWLNRPTAGWQHPAGRIEGTRAYARMLATIGRAEPAVSAYLILFDLGIPPAEEIERRLLVARYYASQGRTSEARAQALRVLALDPANTEARELAGR